MTQVKPLNVATPVSNGIQQKGVGISESERVMDTLKDVVSKDDPSMSYSMEKKIGRGASGLVYVAKVKGKPLSPIAKQVLLEKGNGAQVAIKKMGLEHQPRKEFILKEIMVMKDSKHWNIVNFLDAFLCSNFTQLWVVMEYMEGKDIADRSLKYPCLYPIIRTSSADQCPGRTQTPC